MDTENKIITAPWRKGDPCEICGQPVSMATRTPRRRTHISCQIKAIEERQRAYRLAVRAKGRG